jgi:membrane protein implicated in regulation of membrane protease activity
MALRFLQSKVILPFDFTSAIMDDAGGGQEWKPASELPVVTLVKSVADRWTMAVFFLVCAVVGGTILLCQFGLTLVGFGGEHGFDFGHDVSHDFSWDSAHAATANGTPDLSSENHAADHSHGSSWLFAILSFRTLVAAVTFFGLIGLAAQQAGQPLQIQLLLALAAGIAAIYAVHWLIRSIGRLGLDATQRVQNALGQEATVYVPIAAARAQAGKVQLKLQNRLVEYEAVTRNSAGLPTGTRVRVVGLTGNLLEVEPLNTATLV